jgi:hypothetical protein
MMIHLQTLMMIIDKNFISDYLLHQYPVTVLCTHTLLRGGILVT